MTQTLQEMFPAVDAGIRPLGSRVLVQIRSPMKKSAGGILFSNNDRDTEKWNTQVGRVIQTGPLAFCNRDTQKPWPEGKWCEPGQFVRVPKYGGDRWEVKVGEDDVAMFVLFNDLDLLGVVTASPDKVQAFF